MMLMEPKQIERFWSKVDKSPGHGPNGDCWIWTAGVKNYEGYGGFYLKQIDNTVNAHKLSFLLAHNFGLLDLPKGIMVRHLCNNPPCVNPDHLALGTGKDNGQDMVLAGHSQIGTKNKKAKLDWAKVAEIRLLWATGKYPRRALGAMYGVDASVIAKIICNKAWVDASYVPVWFPDTESHRCKVPKNTVLEIRRFLAMGVPVKQIAEDTGVSQSQIYNIKANRQRKEVVA